MAPFEMELNPVDFLTVGTVGPRGQRVFYIQAAQDDELVTLTVEKMQVQALAEAVTELLDELKERYGTDEPEADIDFRQWDFELRDPIVPQFRVAQIGLGYDEPADRVVLVTQELVTGDDELEEPGVVRFWGSRELMRALAAYADRVVERGRPDPKKNGRIHYYWT
jgi:uncharacterized repeat protein (TIGR03847 family)